MRLDVAKEMDKEPEQMDSDEERKVISQKKPLLKTPVKKIAPVKYFLK